MPDVIPSNAPSSDTPPYGVTAGPQAISPPRPNFPRNIAISVGRSQLRAAVDTVSVRMILIILLSSLPLAALTGGVSWHNYELTSEASALRGQALLKTLRDHAQQDLMRSRQFMVNVASFPELGDAARCGPLLATALATQRQHYRSLSVIDQAGGVLCSAGEPADLPRPVPRLPAEGQLGMETVSLHPIKDGTSRMFVELALPIPGGPRRFLLADAGLGWKPAALVGADSGTGLLDSALGSRAWLLGPHDLVASACLGCGWSAPADLARAARLAASAQGTPVAMSYGSVVFGTLAGPVGLVAVTRPTKQEVHALSLFIVRVIGIVLLLGVGLLGVTIGANILVVSPLSRLTRAVTQWRRAGDYDPGRSRLMPVELRELSRAFHQATRSLARHEHGLREAETRQELLIKEIHHRVKNNLQIIASLLNLQANRIRLPEARAEFASARDRVRALATLHRYLYSEGDLQTLNMRSFLQELCAQLFQAIGEKQGGRIHLHIEAPEIAMATDQAVPLALVVTEAISNAIKYAFPGGRGGHVRVSLCELEQGMARLTLEDDGIGIPAGRADTETGVRDGLGIQLIRGFSRQLGAQLDVREEDGTRYTLTFPLRPKEADIAPLGQTDSAGETDSADSAEEEAGWT